MSELAPRFTAIAFRVAVVMIGALLERKEHATVRIAARRNGARTRRPRQPSVG